jgi:murein DD-endopeptidase MepM/ murein hydrolase activator NlpD
VPIRLVVAAVVASALWLAAGVAPAADGVKASATAFAVVVRASGQGDVTAGYSSAPPAASGTASGYSYPGDGSIVTVGAASSSARTGPGAAAHATASASLERVSLFGGEINIADVSLAAEGHADSSGASGDLSASSLSGLAVSGNGLAPGPNERVELGDWGYAVVLEQAVQREDADGPGYRGFVTGFHVYVTKAHGGLPAGSEILIGYAEAAAQAPPPPASPDTGGGGNGGEEDPPLVDGGARGHDMGRDPTPAPPGADHGQPPIVRNPPPDVRPDITGAGYVFPVYGQVSFTDDFGAPRAQTIWHHGNDIFAPLGAPVLAVSDGTLFLVGWNDLGGQRLWLRDTQGNEYYYAHLSAFSPLAVDGARVRAGDVVGFVGATGDAVGTPPHLHFEIHPKALLGLGYDGVINPYPYLVAWHARRDESFRVTIPTEARGGTPQPGAVLLDVNDISTASGLDPDELSRALALPGLLEELGVPRPVIAPALVGGAPGFGA